ncbi:Guanylate kinase, partial [Armadillidium vulgare]
MPPRPVVVVFCGPSGVGKSTLLRKLMSEYENCFAFSVSHTTREPRKGEEDNVHYHFVPRDEMTEAVERGDFFIEHAVFAGNMYGTSRRAVETILNSNRICILDIEIEGVKQIKKSDDDLNPYYIFIKPPSMEELEARLITRGTETKESKNVQRSLEKKERKTCLMDAHAVEIRIKNDMGPSGGGGGDGGFVDDTTDGGDRVVEGNDDYYYVVSVPRPKVTGLNIQHNEALKSY